MTTLTDNEKALKLAAMRGIKIQGIAEQEKTEVKFDLAAELAKKNIIVEGNVFEALEKDPMTTVYVERRADGKFIISLPK